MFMWLYKCSSPVVWDHFKEEKSKPDSKELVARQANNRAYRKQIYRRKHDKSNSHIK